METTYKKHMCARAKCAHKAAAHYISSQIWLSCSKYEDKKNIQNVMSELSDEEKLEESEEGENITSLPASSAEIRSALKFLK